MWTALCALLMLAGSLARAASPEFPLPASAAVCPSFARYIRLHRAALGTLGTGPLPLGSFPDGRRFARRGHHHHQQQHGSSSSTHLLHPRRRRVLAGLAAGAGMPQPRARARWLVTADPDGLADRLVNAVSSFYFALLTDRVLCIQPAHAGQPGLEAAFSAPSIDWTCRGAPAPLPGPVAAWNPTEDDAWMDPHFEVYTTFVRSHLNTVGPHNATTIELRMHRGISVALFQACFPLPASAAVCPSFARYIRLHRAALGTLGTGPLPLGSFPDGRRFARRGHHHHQQQHGSSSSTHLLHPRRRRVLAGLAAGAGMPQPRARARWLVTADPDGLADRLVNAVSSFYFALLTDRVLCIQPAHAGQPGLEAAFSAPSIDWTCRGAPAPLPGPVAAWNPTEDDAWMDPHFEVYTTFVRSHLNTVGPHNATTIELRMHRGISNQHHRAQMERMGLRPDTAFGCAVQFLFGLGAETRALAEADPGLHGVMVDEGAIKIGIQVRLGDAHILAQLEKNGETELDEKSRGIISGFLQFGSRLLALNQTAVQFYQNVTAAGLRATALEHWYFSRCHQHVITGHSGMGRTAAFAGLRPGPGLFSMEVADGTRMAGRGCEVGDADRPFDVYNTWSGV
ncbi:hypothetical protein TSOC_010775 [Tetrabaena socialis]|uniref:Uncharacterized protein n=1 Tax=Tetrabaena socialis TaxID=47790 RepID=A0A2J7ZSC5_9CHLO|nr:hypothetical protein TSOC_010775 [Tetrabaena socialis]|eukprot:PNH03174.1 hypothetical protein TSOC_010775 [Tetrabaena socialis]